ncbi:vWA domain-containing protein [Bdellovibrio sp. HCB337]|uniref:vWA domain-containing protein n=1 Tax=Bdellovibrio sp. HCB337 TaxID=3394358 RepID=UPI0039A740D2
MRPFSQKFNFGPLGLLMALSLLIGCQRARLEPNWPKDQQQQGQGQTQIPDSGPLQPQSGDFCKPASIQPNKIVKVLFLVDASGSNFGQYGTVPSDPDKKWRSHTLRKFITQYVDKENIYFGLVLFQGTSAKAKIAKQGHPSFSNQRDVVSQGYKAFLRNDDGGNTPYKAALKMAKDAIAADLQKNADDQASYVVVTISDGLATDYKSPEQVIPDAASIMELAPSRITLNSVYYARRTRSSIPPYLKSIADIGHGSFVMADTRQSLKLEDVMHVPAISCAYNR